MNRCPGAVPLLLPFLFLAGVPAAAQEYARHEITVGTDFQTYGVNTCTLIGSGPFCNPGVDHYGSLSEPSIAYTYNLSPSLALEGTAVPTSFFRKTNGYGSGRETLALGGVKTGWRGRKWGVFGEIQAGIGSFSCDEFYDYPAPYSNCTRITNFALEYGGTVQRQITRRWALRLDAGHLLIPHFDQIVARYQDGYPLLSGDGQWLQHLDMRLGITRTFGALRSAQREPEPALCRWDAGVLFSLQPRAQPEWQFLNPYPSWGIFASWNFSRHVSWDFSALHAGRNPGLEFIDYQSGGRSFEALTGAKIGIRRDHMGYFAKIRGGTITFGKTERQLNISSSNFSFVDGMFTNPVLDVGGIYEVYPARHLIIRAEAGSATIFYQPKNVIYNGQAIPIPGQSQTMMLVSFGTGFRF